MLTIKFCRGVTTSAICKSFFIIKFCISIITHIKKKKRINFPFNKKKNRKRKKVGSGIGADMNSGRVRFENIPFPSNEISGSVWSKRKSTKLTKFSLGKLRVDLCFSLPPFPYAHTKISPIFTTLPHRSTLLRYSNLSLSLCLVLLLKYCFNFILLLLSFWKTLSRFFFFSFSYLWVLVDFSSN